MNKSDPVMEWPAGSAAGDVMFVSRQPLYTGSAKCIGYRLLYQQDAVEPESFLSTLMDIGLESFVGDSLAFIRIPPALIRHDSCRALPKEKVVLEVSTEAEPDEPVFHALSGLKESGYELALHDLSGTEYSRPLLDLATYISVDFERLNPEEVAGIAGLSKSKARLIARRVETHEAFEVAKSMGFEYFAGSCFIRPRIATPNRIPINRLSTVQLVVRLQRPDLTTTELEQIIAQDLAVSYKLLHYVNSAALSLPRNITSIRQAIQMIGTERIRSWASLLLLTKLDDKPPELLVTALIRAKMAELLAVAMGAKDPDSYYMVGLFSLVDALLNLPIADAIQLLPFSTEVREALVRREGTLGRVLDAVVAYENGQWDKVRQLGLPPGTVRVSYLESVAAARGMPGVIDSKP